MKFLLNALILALDKLFIIFFSTTFVKQSNFDNNFFYNYIYHSKLTSRLANINFKVFYKKKIYIGRHLFSYQWGNNNKKKTFKKIIERYLLSNKNKINYLEIGSYAGGSLLEACKIFKNLKFDYLSYAIDLHDKIYNSTDLKKFSLYSKVEEYSKSKKVKKLFDHNIKYSKYNIKYFNSDIDGFILKVDLKKIDKINIFYIDAGHMYNDVLNDIQKCLKIAFTQKTKEFLIFGDDHGLPYEKVKNEYDKNYLITDTIRSKTTGTTFHPGVTKAVYDCFGNVKSENGIWYKQFNF
jgi:hypothetical protein